MSGQLKTWDAAPLSADVDVEEEAAALVAQLIRDISVRADIVERIKGDLPLRRSVREAALDIADRYQEDPSLLDNEAWYQVISRAQTANEYSLALRKAQAACAIKPESGNYLTTLGVAQYRTRRFAEAVDTLSRAEKLHVPALKPGSFPSLINADDGAAPHRARVDLAFLAMAHHQLGQGKEAQAYLDRLRESIKEAGSVGQETQSLLAESEAVLKDASR
jgi:hypothetical protein